MRINALRKELAVLLDVQKADRPPVLRRSGQAEWIYSTDALLFLPGEDGERLLDELTGSGWEYEEANGWIQLRKTADEPPENWYGEGFGPEASCCLSLLKRHRRERNCGETAVQRMLIKAGEKGEKAYETACAGFHREWAERLRQGRPLPMISLKYFGG